MLKLRFVRTLIQINNKNQDFQLNAESPEILGFRGKFLTN